MKDPVRGIADDHADLNRRLLALGSRVRSLSRTGGSATNVLVHDVEALRDLLLLHFAREEEALFPFVSDAVPDLRDQAEIMALAHDTICGALARMVRLVATDAPIVAVAALFDRLENTYAAHAQAESELLESLEHRLDASQRERLVGLLAGV